MKKALIIMLVIGSMGLLSCTEKVVVPLSSLSLDKHALITDCNGAVEAPDDQLQSFKDFIVYIWQHNTSDVTTSGCRFATDIPSISILFRADGAELVQKWSPVLETPADLAEFIVDTKNSLTDAQQRSINAIEIYLSHSYQEMDYTDRKQRNHLRGNIHTGVKGIEITYGEALERYHPGYPIVRKLKNRHMINNFFKKYNLNRSDAEKNLIPEKIQFRMFKGAHLLVYLDKTPRIYHMHRSNQTIPLRDVTKASIRKWMDLSRNWLINNVHDDGRMTYRYLPGDGKESNDNNMIRQWMSSVALGRAAAKHNSQEVWDLSEKNIDYNLSKFYYKKDGFGYIEYNNISKLGAISLAALAIIEHQKRDKWKEQEQALLKSIDSLWHEDGSFTTLMKPANGNKTWGINFYPGETQMMWSVLYKKTKDPKLLEKIMQTFRYYSKWHVNVRNRKPSFIPWHTQAYYNVWQITKNEELKDFVFLTNDWLVEKMLASRNIYPDTIGRFYNPNRIPYIPKGNYGVPHASATGVYLEGLIDAYKMAKAVGDMERAEKYRRAMLKGMRSMMQLQFQDEVDMYYIKPEMQNYVKGGVKEHVYKNEIRCDNVQHPYMGMLRIYDEFSEKDYHY